MLTPFRSDRSGPQIIAFIFSIYPPNIDSKLKKIEGRIEEPKPKTQKFFKLKTEKARCEPEHALRISSGHKKRPKRSPKTPSKKAVLTNRGQVNRALCANNLINSKQSINLSPVPLKYCRPCRLNGT